ncbi:MAG: hypothetical protein ACJAXA_000763 [Candidatus Aldehydirespiratoraceae bacterium]|jgi:hypothetical protein
MRGRGADHRVRVTSRRIHKNLAVALVVVVALSACSGSDDANGITNEDVTKLGQTAVGTCLQFGDDVGEEITELPVIACNVPHSHEIYAIVTSGETVYPGFDALEETALTECLGAFEDYIGVSPFDSSLIYSWLVPTLNSWNEEEDREIICVAANGNAAPLSQSFRGSQL